MEIVIFRSEKLFGMKKEIGVAFLGSSFAQRAQAPAFEAVGGVKLIGASSPNSAESFAKAFNMPVHTSSWKELVKRDDVDLVCITTPPRLHCEQTLYALSCGKHVLCEKPFSMNVHEAEAMCRMAEGKKVLAVVDHELRFSPAIRHLRDLVRKGMLGKLYYVTIASHIMYKRDPMNRYSWWSDKEWGGGAWGAIGSHLIDQLHFHIGDIKESKVMKQVTINERPDENNIYHEVSADDTASAIVRFDSGITGQVLACMVAAQNRFDLEITGKLGALRIDIDHRLYFAEPGQPYREIEVPLTQRQKELNALFESSRITARSMFSRAFVHFADAIVRTLQEGRTTIEDAATFEDGVKVMRVMEG
jgi:predicted dehydrogenase